jgi:hypothetical protein
VAAAIQQEFGLEAELIPGGGGIFDVKLGPRVVYSNDSVCGIPDDETVLAALREAGLSA